MEQEHGGEDPGGYPISGGKRIPGFGGRLGFPEHGGKTKEKSSCCAEDGSTDRTEKKVRISDYTPYRARGAVSVELPYYESRANCNTANTMHALPTAGYAEIRAGGTHPREVLREIAAEMYADIDPREYETQRLRRLFQKEVLRSGLDANLIAMSISAVLVDGNGNVKIRLKNDQIVERGEQNG